MYVSSFCILMRINVLLFSQQCRPSHSNQTRVQTFGRTCDFQMGFSKEDEKGFFFLKWVG